MYYDNTILYMCYTCTTIFTILYMYYTCTMISTIIYMYYTCTMISTSASNHTDLSQMRSTDSQISYTDYSMC